MSMKFLSSLQSLPPKDRQRLLALALVLLALILWTWQISPALKTLRDMPAQLAQLQDQTQQLKLMQAQAQALQKSPRIQAKDARTLLQKVATENLDNGARLNIEGSRATLNISRVSAESLAQFLALARTQAQALPIEAQLQKFTDAGATKTNTPADLWRGTLILSLPGG
ncbi:MAG: type II secretion system protein GspM [Limnohabitans sp.]